MSQLHDSAQRHLILQATDWSVYDEGVRVFTHGDGCLVWDEDGKEYLDAFSGQLCCAIGHGFGDEFAEVAAAQLKELAYWSNWHTAHPRSIELAAKVAELAPGDLERVMFCSSGSEGIETAIKFALTYHRLCGNPQRHKFISRSFAYHGLTLGALSLTGIGMFREPFEQLLGPEVHHISNTDRYRRPEGETEEQFTQFLLDELESLILREGPDTFAAVFVEPVQNAGGMPTPPKGYHKGLREICDRYGILLVADEVCTGFGRVGEWFGSIRYDIRPDIIVFAKAITSARFPIAGVIVRDAVFEPFKQPGNIFLHGHTWGGHPVGCALALKNLEIMEREDVLGNVRRNEPYLRESLESLLEYPIVGDVRGAGYFQAFELVRDKKTKETFSDEECDRLFRDIFSPRLIKEGVICRYEDRAVPVVQTVMPLIAGPPEIDRMVSVFRMAVEEVLQHIDD